MVHRQIKPASRLITRAALLLVAKVRLWLSLTLILSGGLTSPAFASSQNVALAIFFEDVEGAFTPELFERYLREKPADLSVPLRGIFVKRSDSWADIQAKLRGALAEDDKVSGLILGSHGCTVPITNDTSLERLGTLGLFGVRGPIKSIFEELKGRMSSSLFIYLQACSTFKGPQWAIRARVKKLYESLGPLGVQNLWIWGATQPLNGDLRHRAVDFGPENPGLHFTAGLAAGMLAGLFTYSQSSSSALSFMAAFPAFLAGTASSKRFLEAGPADIHGWLVNANSSQFSMEYVNADDPKVLNVTSCSSLLVKENTAPQ